jgi:hypothetical protein
MNQTEENICSRDESTQASLPSTPSVSIEVSSSDEDMKVDIGNASLKSKLKTNLTVFMRYSKDVISRKLLVVSLRKISFSSSF